MTDDRKVRESFEDRVLNADGTLTAQFKASRFCIVCYLQIFPGESCPHIEVPLIEING